MRPGGPLVEFCGGYCDTAALRVRWSVTGWPGGRPCMPASARKKARVPRSAERTRSQFLSAAEEVFGSHGYEGTTIRVIARTAGVNLATLQHCWGGKRQLRARATWRAGPVPP